MFLATEFEIRIIYVPFITNTIVKGMNQTFPVIIIASYFEKIHIIGTELNACKIHTQILTSESSDKLFH